MMLKKIPIRMRFTMLTVLLLTICCIILTYLINISAFKMAEQLQVPLQPSQITYQDENGIIIPAMPIDATTTIPAITVQTAKRGFSVESIISMLLIIVAGGILTHYFSGKTLKPLSELSSQMKNRTVHNLSEGLPVPASRDEIADLTLSFNEMSTKLDEAFAMQKRFSQSAAHELRTPLTVLKTKVDVFKKRSDHTPEEYDNLLTVITTHTNRLSELVYDLLDLSNMDALECDQAVKVKSLLNEVGEELSTVAQKKNIGITVFGDELCVKGNQSLLHRAFYNLVENAIKYNFPDGSITISLSSRGDGAVITVEDSGIGIPDEMKKLIFEPFFRVDKSRSRQVGGAGLGLSMVKSILDKHRGSIAVFDNAGGSVFEVVLPLYSNLEQTIL